MAMDVTDEEATILMSCPFPSAGMDERVTGLFRRDLVDLTKDHRTYFRTISGSVALARWRRAVDLGLRTPPVRTK